MSPPWLPELREALHQNRRQRHVQVATSGPESGPTVRTVVLREVDDEGQLVFFTDTRSEKVVHLKADPRVEVHAWWTKGRTQFRLRGEATISTDDADRVRLHLWSRLTEEDLERFYGPPPGTPLPTHAFRAPELEGVAETFAIVRVRPTSVDVLRLLPEVHERTRYRLIQGAWSTVTVQA